MDLAITRTRRGTAEHRGSVVLGEQSRGSRSVQAQLVGNCIIDLLIGHGPEALLVAAACHVEDHLSIRVAYLKVCADEGPHAKCSAGANALALGAVTLGGRAPETI